jgi:tRNA(Ile)-lysidine synthetase-like protein
LADEAAGVSRFLDDLLSSEKFCENLRLAKGVKVDSQVFERTPRSIWPRLIRLALRRARGDLRRVERAHLNPVEELIRAGGTGGPLPIPGAAEVHVDRGTLLVFPSQPPDRPTGSGQPAVAGSGVWNVRFAALGAIAEIRTSGPELVEDLEVRARRKGDRVYGSRSKFKELLIEHRVPRPYRNFVPVLASGDRIVACPGLLRCRREGVEVSWLLDEEAPYLDIDFPRSGIP